MSSKARECPKDPLQSWATMAKSDIELMVPLRYSPRRLSRTVHCIECEPRCMGDGTRVAAHTKPPIGDPQSSIGRSSRRVGLIRTDEGGEVLPDQIAVGSRTLYSQLVSWGG
jgi:hypothetical protein